MIYNKLGEREEKLVKNNTYIIKKIQQVIDR